MTHDEMVLEIKDRLNLTGRDVSTHISRRLNYRYRRLTASLGLDGTRRTKVSANTTIGSNELTFASIEHIENVIDERTEPYEILRSVSFDEIRASGVEGDDSDDPHEWAVKSMTATGVTIVIDVMAKTAFALKADGLGTLSELSGSASPQFPVSYHYLLIDGVMADELRKRGERELARDAEMVYEKGLSDLRMFLAKSAYMDIQQNKLKNRTWMFNSDLR